MKKLELTVLVVAAGFLGYGASHAETSSEKQNLQQTVSRLQDKCGSDVDKLCSGVTPGEGRIAACLESKEDQLSDSCKTAWKSTKQDLSKRMDQADVAFRKNCGSDVQKFCSDVPSGKGRLWSCLDQHRSDLSNSCKTFQAKIEQKVDKFLG